MQSDNTISTKRRAFREEVSTGLQNNENSGEMYDADSNDCMYDDTRQASEQARNKRSRNEPYSQKHASLDDDEEGALESADVRTPQDDDFTSMCISTSLQKLVQRSTRRGIAEEQKSHLQLSSRVPTLARPFRTVVDMRGDVPRFANITWATGYHYTRDSVIFARLFDPAVPEISLYSQRYQFAEENQ
jgi:hypothetical protein